MGTGRWKRNKPVRRLKKTKCEKSRRQRVQKKRLVALGVDATKVAKMNPKKVRTLLKRPAKAKKTAEK